MFFFVFFISPDRSRCAHLEPPHLVVQSEPSLKNLNLHSVEQNKRCGIGEMGCAKVLLVMFVIGFEKGICVNWNPVPRKTVKYNGEYLMTKQNSERFLPAVTAQQMSPLSCSRFFFSQYFYATLFICPSLSSFLQSTPPFILYADLR